jgi:transcriptional regulator with XRE-family HTH domain
VRIARLLTQQALAEAAGMSPATIVRLEHPDERAELRTIATLAQVLQVSPAVLMGEEELPATAPRLPTTPTRPAPRTKRR